MHEGSMNWKDLGSATASMLVGGLAGGLVVRRGLCALSTIETEPLRRHRENICTVFQIYRNRAAGIESTAVRLVHLFSDPW